MTTYSVYLPQSVAASSDNLAERSRIVPDSFTWGGFFVPVLWLLFNRLWLNVLLILTLQVILALGMPHLGLPSGFTFAGGLILMLLVGLEGRKWLCAGLERRGYRLIDVVAASSPDEALHRLLVKGDESEATPATSTMRAPQSRGVIGLFPGPDWRQ